MLCNKTTCQYIVIKNIGDSIKKWMAVIEWNDDIELEKWSNKDCKEGLMIPGYFRFYCANLNENISITWRRKEHWVIEVVGCRSVKGWIETQELKCMWLFLIPLSNWPEIPLYCNLTQGHSDLKNLTLNLNVGHRQIWQTLPSAFFRYWARMISGHSDLFLQRQR